LLSSLVAAVIAASSLYSAPAVEAPKAQVLQIQETVKENERKKTEKNRCKDQVVAWIREAGIKGASVRVAWAIAQRESNGNPNENTYPDLGIVQLNSPAWSGTKYWPDNIYDPVQSFTAMRKMVRDMNWQPWGLRVHKGQVSYDFSAYGGWSSWHHQNWIVIPFERYYAQFPKKCL
jgi:hypothetical protein